ncbi:MAG: hypothetical protein OEZ10_05635 [Gammaproteobacteria bacterium]|nr:hypothetical protein [Gammaproteobacteria bacterium]
MKLFKSMFILMMFAVSAGLTHMASANADTEAQALFFVPADSDCGAED